MAEVHIVDIQGEQWDIKDLPLTARVAILETKFSEMKAIRHDISQNPPQATNNIWSCLMNQIIATDWSFLTKDVCAYGEFTIITVGWGNYKAMRFSDNTIILSGVFEYGIEPHTFEAVFYPPSNAWRFNIDGEGLSYLQNNVLVTYKMSRVNNGFAVPTEVTLRNVAEVTIGNIYSALEACSLLDRPSTGIIVWDLTRNHDGVDLPKIKRGYPQIAAADEAILTGRAYLQNIRIGRIDTSSELWWFTWNDGNTYEAGNMYGESENGVVKSITMVFSV